MVVSLLVPTACAACGRLGPSPCAVCWRALRPAPPAPPPPGIDAIRSLLLYEGVARELVARIKYRNARAVIAWLASGMAALITRWLPITAITWAPTTPARRHERGFDQAELLARAVAAELHVPARRLLARGPGPPQTGRPAAERTTGVRFTATGAAIGRSPPTRLVVVDDVCTTGATLAAAASALRASATTAEFTAISTDAPLSLIALTAARTPLKLNGGSADA